jgi:hypothetical protein
MLAQFRMSFDSSSALTATGGAQRPRGDGAGTSRSRRELLAIEAHEFRAGSEESSGGPALGGVQQAGKGKWTAYASSTISTTLRGLGAVARMHEVVRAEVGAPGCDGSRTGSPPPASRRPPRGPTASRRKNPDRPGPDRTRNRPRAPASPRRHTHAVSVPRERARTPGI